MNRSKELQRSASELLEVISFLGRSLKISKILRQLAAQGPSMLPVNHWLSRVFQKSFAATAATDLTYGMQTVSQEAFFDDPSSVASTAAPAGSSKAAGLSPDSARGNLERGDEQSNGAQRQSIPQLRFVRSLPTVELPSFANWRISFEKCHGRVAEEQRLGPAV